MKRIRIAATTTLAVAAALAALLPAGAQAQAAAKPMVEWVLPATATNKPQT